MRFLCELLTESTRSGYVRGASHHPLLGPPAAWRGHWDSLGYHSHAGSHWSAWVRTFLVSRLAKECNLCSHVLVPSQICCLECRDPLHVSSCNLSEDVFAFTAIASSPILTACLSMFTQVLLQVPCRGRRELRRCVGAYHRRLHAVLRPLSGAFASVMFVRQVGWGVRTYGRGQAAEN